MIIWPPTKIEIRVHFNPNFSSEGIIIEKFAWLNCDTDEPKTEQPVI